jgi:hypothetical protein
MRYWPREPDPMMARRTRSLAAAADADDAVAAAVASVKVRLVIDALRLSGLLRVEGSSAAVTGLVVVAAA